MDSKRITRMIVAAIGVAFLAACASGGAGVRASDLRNSSHFRAERTVPFTFPKIQMALFKHQAACGTAFKFAMEPRETAYATITDKPADTDNYEHAVLADLVQYQASMFAEARVKMRVYTYYADDQSKQRVAQLFNAISHPEVCPGAPMDEDADKPEASGVK
ncbi:MAG TPA: hypothetical protein VNQ97_05270 [Burkholderiaceae bacterium]|nr:hypothetical protein [Burkholderiaceae bacterium]